MTLFYWFICLVEDLDDFTGLTLKLLRELRMECFRESGLRDLEDEMVLSGSRVLK